MFTKKEELEKTVQIIESVQPKKCCLYPHKGCQPSQDFLDSEEKRMRSKEYWKEKLESLQKS